MASVYLLYIYPVYLKKHLPKELGLFFQAEVDVLSSHMRKLLLPLRWLIFRSVLDI